MSLAKIVGWWTAKRILLVCTLLVLIPTYFPLGLPLEISFTTKDFMNALDALKPGDKVVFGIGAWDYVTEPDFSSAMIKAICDRQLKFVVVSWYPVAPIGFDINAHEQVRIEETYGYVYGTDYVIFPFTAGDEAAMAAIAADFWGTFSTDYYGNPIEELPLMEDIRTLDDFDLAIIEAGQASDYYLMIVRQWPAKYEIPTLQLTHLPITSAYYGTYITGGLDGLRGRVEFEIEAGHPGEEVAKVEARNIGQTLIIIACFMGIAANYMARTKKESVKA